jgi:hypothetical protein
MEKTETNEGGRDRMRKDEKEGVCTSSEHAYTDVGHQEETE